MTDESTNTTNEVARLRELLESTKAQWKAQCERLRKERDAFRGDLDREFAGNQKLRAILGARDGETMFMVAERVVRGRDDAIARADRLARELSSKSEEWARAVDLAERAVKERDGALAERDALRERRAYLLCTSEGCRGERMLMDAYGFATCLSCKHSVRLLYETHPRIMGDVIAEKDADEARARAIPYMPVAIERIPYGVFVEIHPGKGYVSCATDGTKPWPVDEAVDMLRAGTSVGLNGVLPPAPPSVAAEKMPKLTADGRDCEDCEWVDQRGDREPCCRCAGKPKHPHFTPRRTEPKPEPVRVYHLDPEASDPANECRAIEDPTMRCPLLTSIDGEPGCRDGRAGCPTHFDSTGRTW